MIEFLNSDKNYDGLLTEYYNNLNPYILPAYFSIRSSVKQRKQNANDYMGILCPKDVQDPVPINKSSVLSPIRNKLKYGNATNMNRKGHINLYDEDTFSNNRTYMIDYSQPFTRDSLLDALRATSKNPLLFINSNRYNPMEKYTDCNQVDIGSTEYNIHDLMSNMSFLDLVDPHNIIQTVVSSGLMK